MIASEDSSQWGQARIKLKKIMEAEGKFAANAEEMYYESHRKSLVYHAENGNGNRLQTENVQKFGKAVRHQQDGKDVEASDLFSELVVDVQPDGKERHIYFESQARLKELAEREALPTDVAQLNEMIEQAKGVAEPAQLMAAQQLLARIALEFYAVEGYEETVRSAKAQLTIVKYRIARERNTDQLDPGDTDGDGS